MYCGIDIGKENMGITFIDNGTVISYKGTLSELYKYVYDKEPILIKIEDPDGSIGDICKLLTIIPELKETKRTYIEMQISMHNNSILRLEGTIYGFLYGRYPHMDIQRCSSTIRNSFATAYLNKVGRPNTIRPKGLKPEKVDTFLMAQHLYPAYISYLMEYLSKMDDMSDSILYAYMAKIETLKIKSVQGRAAAALSM